MLYLDLLYKKSKKYKNLHGGLAMKIREMFEKKMKEKQRKQKAKMLIKVTAGAAAGVAAGVIGGVLVAPKSGKETREDIAKTAKDLGETAVTKSVEMKEILDNKVVETKINATIAKEKISKYLSDRNEEKNNDKNKDDVVIEEVSEIDPITETEE